MQTSNNFHGVEDLEIDISPLSDGRVMITIETGNAGISLFGKEDTIPVVLNHNGATTKFEVKA